MKVTSFLIASMSFCIASVSVSASVSASAPLTDLPVVKVRSTLSGGPTFTGSGVVFQANGREWVITSDHVIFHTAQDVRNTIQGTSGKLVPVSLHAVDWGVGLALLEIEGPAPVKAPLPSLGSFQTFTPARGTFVSLQGFPHASETALIDSHAAVLNPQSDRHEVALLDSMIELSVGAHAEYGMSGGGAFSSDGSRLIGILSHQYVELVPGRPSRIGTFNLGSTELQNHVLLISAKDARRWIEKVIATDAVLPSFVLDPEEQALGRTVVLSNHLRFMGDCQQAHGVGGGDGHGIGGGDGSGIGGGSGDASCQVRITSRHTDRGLPVQNSTQAFWNWSSMVSRALGVGKSVTVAGFMRVDAQGAIHRLPILSLAGFFHEQCRSGDMPLTQLDEINTTDALVTDGRAVVEAVARVRATASRLEPEARILLNSLETVGRWAASLSRTPLKATQLEALEKDKEWDVLFHAAFDPSVEAMNHLIRIRRNAQNP